MWQRPLDERFTLSLVGSQVISPHTITWPNLNCPRNDGSKRSIRSLKRVVLVVINRPGLHWPMIVTTQKWFTICNLLIKVHQQQLQVPSGTPGCSRRLWWLWQNLVPSDGELSATRRPGDGSCCIRTPSVCRDVYTPSDGHVCYTLCRGCTYAEAIYTMPGNVKPYLLLIVQRFSKLMHSVCILINVSMYFYSYLSPHSISGLAACSDCRQFEVRLKMTTNMYSPLLSPPWLPLCLCTPAVAH